MRIKLLRAAIAAVVLCLAQTTIAAELPRAKPEAVGLSSERLGVLRKNLEQRIDNGTIPGAVVIIARHGNIAWFEAMGWRDPQAKAAMTKDAIFRLYSMSKPITSVTAMMLYETGQLAVFDPLSKYVPAFGEVKVGVEKPGDAEGKPTLELVAPMRPIRLHDLLRHTSGLTYSFFGKGAVKQLYTDAKLSADDPDNATFVERLAKLPLAYHPSTTWDYSVSTDVLGRVIEVATGKSLLEAERERLLGPLGMVDTAFDVAEAAKQGRIAEALASDNSTGGGAPMFDPRKPRRFQSGGGGMVGTAMDYARFAQMLLNGGTLEGKRYLMPRTVAFMTADHTGGMAKAPFWQTIAGVDGVGFGLGFAVRRENGGAPWPGSAGDYGWDGAAGTTFWIDPKEDLFVIAMIQAPKQLGATRALLRDLVYAAIVK